MQVLVADSNAEYRLKLTKRIKKYGQTVVEALNEHSVLQLCKKKCPDLLFISDNLSGVSAVELVRKIRQLGGSAVWNTIVLLGEKPTTEALSQGIKAGADDFITQPISDIQLLYKIKSAVRHQELKEDIFTMAHDLAVANRALEGLSTQDVMTGVIDTTRFHQLLEDEWFKAKKEQHDLALVLVDVDCFRAYNEIYGADVGDQRIKEIATSLSKVVPEEYKLARTSGKTFGLLMPKVDPKAAFDLAKSLVKQVMELKILHKGSPCSDYVTASAGAAITSEGGFKEPLDLLEAADYALYKAKHTGRNQVYFEAVKV